MSLRTNSTKINSTKINSTKKILTDEEIEEEELRQREEANDNDFDYFEMQLNKSNKLKCNVKSLVKKPSSANNDNLTEVLNSKEEVYRLKQLKIQEKQKMKKEEEKKRLELNAVNRQNEKEFRQNSTTCTVDDIINANANKNNICDDWEDLL